MQKGSISMNIHLCKGDETVEEALEYINETDKEGRRFACDPVADRCYVGDEVFRTAPVLINYKNTYYALREVK